MLLKKAIYRLGKGNLRGNAADNIGDELSQKMTEYASNLAAQGALQAAITYLGETKDENESPAVTELRERVQGALGIRSSSASSRRTGSKGPASSQTGRVPQTYGFPAQNTPNPPNAGGWTHPGNASAATYQGSYNAPYSSGIHNPVFDDLNAFSSFFFEQDGRLSSCICIPINALIFFFNSFIDINVQHPISNMFSLLIILPFSNNFCDSTISPRFCCKF